MADSGSKNVALGVGALAVIGGLFAALGKRKPTTSGLQGPPAAPPQIRKGCNCGR